MNTQEKISRLEELLARIQTRAAAPMARAAAPVMVEHAPAVHRTEPPPAVVPVMAEAARAIYPSEPPMAFSEPPVAAADPITTPPPSHEDFGEVEVSSEIVEVDIDIDEPAYLSAARGSEAPEGLSELIEVGDDDDAPRTQTSTDFPDASTMEAPIAALPANEIEEPAPSSSRRPIAAETEAYEAEAPRHTPPPESGKQVATPSAAPPARPTSIPPPSLEGHTLVGGWREPGMPGAGPPGPSLTPYVGVRVPSPVGPSAAPPAQASGTRLTPETSKPMMPIAAHVASFEGVPPAFKPSSFGDLLDATLGL